MILDFKKLCRSLVNFSGAIALLTTASLVISWVVELYCDFFYELGEQAKGRASDHPLVILISTPILFWLSSIICRKYAPNARACNVDIGLDLIQNLSNKKNQKNSPHNSKITEESAEFNLKSALAIAASSLLATYAGGSLGREGTSIQISTILLICIANFYKSKLSHIRLETLIYGGFALGFSIAFNAPLIAFIYAIEKMGWKFFVKHKKNSLKTVLAIAFGIFLLYVFFDGNAVYLVEKIELNPVQNFAIFLLIAVLCGSSAAIFRYLAQIAYNLNSNLKGIKQHLVPMICGFFNSLVAVSFGVYSFGGGIRTVNDALTSSHAILGFSDIFGRMSSTFFTFVAGCAGGLVAPAIAIGATIGSAMSVFSSEAISLACILVGMTAFLSPILKAPIAASLVIVVAANQNFSMTFFMILISIISTAAYKILYSIISSKKFSEKSFK